MLTDGISTILFPCVIHLSLWMVTNLRCTLHTSFKRQVEEFSTKVAKTAANQMRHKLHIDQTGNHQWIIYFFDQKEGSNSELSIITEFCSNLGSNYCPVIYSDNFGYHLLIIHVNIMFTENYLTNSIKEYWALVTGNKGWALL